MKNCNKDFLSKIFGGEDDSGRWVVIDGFWVWKPNNEPEKER